MPQDRKPFGLEDQVLHAANEQDSRSLQLMNPNRPEAQWLRDHLNQEALAVVDSPPEQIDCSNIDVAARDVLAVARFNYLRGAAGVASFVPEPATWYNPEWQEGLRAQLFHLIGDHVDIAVRLISARGPDSDPTIPFGLEPDTSVEVVQVRIAPRL